MRYRLDGENINGEYSGSIHFNTLQEAEKHLKLRKYCIDYENNTIPNNKRYGTIWEV